MRGGVEVVVDHAGAERVLAGALHAACELGAEVGEQLRLADRDRELPARTDQLGVRDRADVVEVERVLGPGRAQCADCRAPVARARVAERAARRARAPRRRARGRRATRTRGRTRAGARWRRRARRSSWRRRRSARRWRARRALGRAGSRRRAARRARRRPTRGRRGWAGPARRARWRGRRGGCGGSGCGRPSAPSSFCGSRHTSWSPLNVPAVLPEPMPTWSSIVPSSCHALSSHASPKRASGSSCGGAAAPSSRRAISSSADA